MSYQFDHRQLADEMEIFFFNDQIGAGPPVWLPNGVAIRDSLENFIKHREQLLGILTGKIDLQVCGAYQFLVF